MSLEQLIIHELSHTIAYLLFIIPVYLYRKSLLNLINITAGFIATLGIDVDHIFDYYFYSMAKQTSMSVANFFKGEYFIGSGKVYVLFHAWELVILLAVLYVIKRSDKYSSVLLFIILGLSAHLVFDTLSYGFNWDVYFISNRLLNNFSDSVFSNI